LNYPGATALRLDRETRPNKPHEDGPAAAIGTYRLAELECAKRHIRIGATLCFSGEPFLNLFSISSGSFKSVIQTESGNERVSGLHRSGDLMGMDAIGAGSYRARVVALEDSQVQVIPYQKFQSLVLQSPKLLEQLLCLMSNEISRRQAMASERDASAEARVANLLVGLAQQSAERGASSLEFNLLMSRRDLGSYLGLSLETVSRTLSRLQEKGLVLVRNRELRILKPDELAALGE
jgi:CRP/FNR family transcriptional regulator